MTVIGLVRGNGARADDDGRSQARDGLRREGSGTDREDATGGARSTRRSGARGCPGSHRGTGTAGHVRAARRGGRAELGKEQLLDEQQGSDRKHGRERVVVGLELLLEEPAAIAVAHVAPRERARLDQALGRLA
jgi:hypothetical protein